MAPVPALPWDIIDLIIDSTYYSDGPEPLKTLSLVSREWRPHSQRCIFNDFSLNVQMMRKIYAESTDASETTGNTPRSQPLTVLSYVRNLYIEARGITPKEPGAAYILQSFTGVTFLEITNWHFQDFESRHIIDFLSHFGATVTTLKLLEDFCDSEVLIYLTSLFPLVRDLWISPRYFSERKTYKIKYADRSRGVGFQGNLVFKHLRPIYDGFLAFVNMHSSDVRSITAYGCKSNGELQNLFDRQGHKLSSVTVGVSDGEGKCGPVQSLHHSILVLTLRFPDPLSLSSCTQLRTLTICLVGSFEFANRNWDVLRTVVSVPHLEGIEVCDFYGTVSGVFSEEWKDIDDLLCQCHDRSEVKTFRRFSLILDGAQYDGGGDWLIECVQRLWPRFVERIEIGVEIRL